MFSLEKRTLRGHITVDKHIKGYYKEDWGRFSLVNEDRARSNGFKLQ